MTKRCSGWNKKFCLIARVKQCVEKWKSFKRNADQIPLPPLSREKRTEAEDILLKEIQKEGFPTELDYLHKKEIHSANARTNLSLKNSPLRKLNVFLDKKGIMRAGTRMINVESLPYNYRFPIVLPKKDENVEALIRMYHEIHAHAGADYTRNALRRKYVIIHDSNTVKSVVRKCVKCQKQLKAPAAQIMGPLPPERVEAGQPFEATGVDLFGPYEVKMGRRKSGKRWAVIFSCLKTRAIHLEVVESMSTPAFINALIRFQARRPGLRKLFSDCGRNFIGAMKLMEEAVKTPPMAGDLAQSMILSPIEWTLLPPYASHRAGVWERLIRSTKRTLSALFEKEKVESDVFNTVIAHAELLVNNRPITQLSNDNINLNALSPCQILYPGIEVVDDPMLVRLQAADAEMLQHAHNRAIHLVRAFWKKWLSDYVSALKHRQKWEATRPNLKENQLVLLVDQTRPRNTWKLGRIVQTNGSDGHVRTVDVETATGRIFNRDVTHVVALELD